MYSCCSQSLTLHHDQELAMLKKGLLKAVGVTIYLVYLLIMFALFGTSASYFARFLYRYWVYKEMDQMLIFKAGGCALLIITLSAIGALLF